MKRLIFLLVFLLPIQTYSQARYFDASDDVASCPDSNSLDLMGDFTIECQLRYITYTTFGTYICKGPTSHESYMLAHSINNYHYLAIEYSDDSSEIFDDSVTIGYANEWHHIAWVFRLNQDARLYQNGNLIFIEAANTGKAGLKNTSELLKFGKRDSVGQYFGGGIDEVRIWSYARTDAQIQSNADKIIADEEPGLVGYWNFDEETGNMFDRSGNGNHITSITGTLSVDNAPIKRIIGE